MEYAFSPFLLLSDAERILSAFPLSPASSLPKKLSAFVVFFLSPSNFQNLLTFSPSTGGYIHQSNMASADFWQFKHTSLYGLLLLNSYSQLTCQTSPLKNNNFHLMSPLHLHRRIRVVLDFVLLGKLVHSTYALYVVSVRRCETLPSASFRFHLTMDTLAVWLMVPTTKPIADFHCQVIAHVGRT